MRILFFSDWRVQPMDWIDRIIEEAQPVDVILYGGDDTARFGSKNYQRIRTLWTHHRLEDKQRSEEVIQARPQEFDRLHVVDPIHRSVIDDNKFHHMASLAQCVVGAVVGNDCLPVDRYLLQSDPVYDLHRRPLRIQHWGIAGIEGSIVSNGNFINTNIIGPVIFDDARVYDHLNDMITNLSVDPRHLIIVSHTPPRGYLDVGLSFGVQHLGSPALSQFIAERSPALVLCGHCHSQGGRVQQVGNTWIVNAASSDRNAKQARAVLIDLQEGYAPQITWIDPSGLGITAISGIGPKREKLLRVAGITTRDVLMQSSIEQLQQAGLGQKMATRLWAKGESDRRGRPVWLPTPRQSLPMEIVLFDVETSLGLDGVHDVWMIGAQAFHGNALDENIVQWTVPKKDRTGRRKMYRGFLEFVQTHGNSVCFWSGSGFDDYTIYSGLNQWSPAERSRWDDVQKYDLKAIMHRSLEVPNSWSQQSVAQFLGFVDEGMPWDGFQIGLAYELYQHIGDFLDVSTIATYNRHDVQALAYIYRWYLNELHSAEALTAVKVPFKRRWAKARLKLKRL